VVENGSGERIKIPARQGASGSAGDAEIVLVDLLEGYYSGKSDGSGRLRWDLDPAHSKDRMATVQFENRGDTLRGRHHVVAVTKTGWRHAMDHTHFIDFNQLGRFQYVLMDVPVSNIDYIELIPFRTRHKFFFNRLEIP
jgi:hypothetical protein